MTRVARYVKMTAQPEQGEALATLMVAIAEGLAGTDGCELYLVNRAVDSPDEIWVTEVWSSQEAVDASLRALTTESGRAALAPVMALLAQPPQRTDLRPLGGVGPGG
ncbi:MAG: putative quinol monooxygenase [Solirubrobacteraceae bacterium]